MKLKVLAALAALMMPLTGCGAAAEAATTKQEDDPGWSCFKDGNKVCGANAIERTAAWGAFRAESVPAELLESGFRVTYLGHALEGVELAPDLITVKSELSAGKVNVFQVVAAR